MARSKRSRRSSSSPEEVMVVSSGEEEGQDATTLNESSVASLLSGVTVTKVNTKQVVELSDSEPEERVTKRTRLSRSAARRSRSQEDPLAQEHRRSRSQEDPLVQGQEAQKELDRLESLKDMLAKSSVAITFQASPSQKTTSTPKNLKTKDNPKSITTLKKSVSTPKPAPPARIFVTPASIGRKPQHSKPLSRSTTKPVQIMKPVVKIPLKPLVQKPVVPKPVKKLPRIIDRGPMDCFDSLIVETSEGFPCNYCEVEEVFGKRREMIGHMQVKHKEELVTEEQKNPDLTGRFPCIKCSAVFHSKFTKRTHEKSHVKAESGSCDNYYRYYLAFAA